MATDSVWIIGCLSVGRVWKSLAINAQQNEPDLPVSSTLQQVSGHCGHSQILMSSYKRNTQLLSFRLFFVANSVQKYLWICLSFLFVSKIPSLRCGDSLDCCRRLYMTSPTLLWTSWMVLTITDHISNAAHFFTLLKLPSGLETQLSFILSSFSHHKSRWP